MSRRSAIIPKKHGKDLKKGVHLQYSQMQHVSFVSN